MHSHGKIFCVPALCIVMLAALVTTASAAVLGSLSGCRTADAARLQPDAGKDAKITSAIQAKLAADGNLNPFNIAVTTNDGVVTLQGRVDKAETREKAERYVRETDGVQRVIDLVKVGDRQ
jgi:osmotically-inducible protein OsmY